MAAWSCGAAFAQDRAPPLATPSFSNDEAWPEATFEIYRLAPGQHEAFVRRVALADRMRAAAGLAPLRLYFHQSGDSWDVLALKVASEDELTPEQEAAMEMRGRELGMPTGPAYFVDLRTTVLEHTDTHAVGPVSAAQWLARLDERRAESEQQMRATQRRGRRR
ncbi:MAG TPA: hypothetical protein VM915_12980 [Verrucomicrobiae bacterium]|nr:hypothetical protein [Verrucomicrobiae bacterium]